MRYLGFMRFGGGRVIARWLPEPNMVIPDVD